MAEFASGYAAVNSLDMYYEIHGGGSPLVMLHGGLGATATLQPALQALAQNRQVIAADLQAHGRTADIGRPLRYELMADDISALLRHLAIARADIMGYSLGAGVAVQTAIRHPGQVRKLVVVSAPFKRQGWFQEILDAMADLGPRTAELLKQSPLYENYSRIAPQAADWPVLFVKLRELLSQDYDWSDAVAAMAIPTLLVMADADSIPVAHAAEFFALLGGGQRDAGWDGALRSPSQLAILPGTTHYNILASSALPAAVAAFLDSSMSKG